MASDPLLRRLLFLDETDRMEDQSWLAAAVPPGAGNGRSRQLHEGIQYSRWFVNLYHAAIGAVILGFAVRHWTTVLKRRRRRRCIENNSLGRRRPCNPPSGSSSSSSSTLEGDATPPDEIDDNHSLKGERVPLLANTSTRSRTGDFKGLYTITRAMFMYQQRPIPFINKELPSNASSLLILLLLGINFFFAFYGVPMSFDMVFIAADRFGLMFVVNLPWLYMLAAKNQPTRWLTGHSYESLNILHRRLGELLCLLAALHFAGMLAVWYTILRPAGVSFLRLILLPLILLGLLAFISYALLYVTSLRSFRQRWYELFLASHIFLQTAGLAFLFFHYDTNRPYVIASLAVFLVDRIIFRFYARSVTASAIISLQADNSTVILRAPIRLHDSRLFRPSTLADSWITGSHIFLTIPPLSPTHILQAHPFSIFSHPPPNGSTKEADLSLLIRAQDGFSKALADYARTHQKTSVRLDGPYGSSSAVDLLRSSDIAVLVAGGSGIALTYPLAEYLATRNQALQDIEAGKRHETSTIPGTNVLFLWVHREAAHVSWLHDPTEGDKLANLRAKGVEVMALGPTRELDEKPNVPELVEQWVAEQGRQRGLVTKSRERPNVGVVACGPEGMMREVRNGCAKMVRDGWNVEIEVEKFGW